MGDCAGGLAARLPLSASSQWSQIHLSASEASQPPMGPLQAEGPWLQRCSCSMDTKSSWEHQNSPVPWSWWSLQSVREREGGKGCRESEVRKQTNRSCSSEEGSVGKEDGVCV